MKKINIILIWVLLSIGVSCQHDESTQSGHVQFSFSAKSSGNSSGRKLADVIPDAASLIISLSKSNGDTVFTWKKIDLLKIGDQFITDPLPLMPGGYIINDFMIRSSSNTLLFIAPKEGSPLSTLVSKPLPISFTVNGNVVVNTAVEVVSADHQNPQDFGYAAFPIKVIPGSGFAVSTFVVNDGGETELTTAKAYILHGDDTLLLQNLKATVNNVNWNNGSNDRFSLVIIKDGYARYEKSFSLDSMMIRLDGKPLAAVLQPAFTVSWSPWRANDDFLGVHIDGFEGANVTIDWGDGSKQRWDFHNGTTSDEINHAYADKKQYFMSVTGDIDAITTIGFYYQSSIIDTLSIANLPNLKSFAMAFFSSYNGNAVDFSQNHVLEEIDFAYLNNNLRMLDISKNPRLTYVNIEHLNSLSASVVNKLIDDLHAAVALNNIRNGTMSLYAYDVNTPVLVGPPSESSKNKLRSLINDYGWYIPTRIE